MLTNNSAYTNALSPNWVIKETLSMGGYDDDQIMLAMDVNNTTSEEQLERAAEVIEEFVEGKIPKMNFNADTGFVQKLIDYSLELNLEPDVIAKVVSYAEQHLEIAAQNTLRKKLATAGMQPTPANGLSTNNVPGITTMNIPNPEAGNVQARSQALTNTNK